ncbi:hypothetical protein WOLCODRAFT_136434 [Wolfiporia cocos MD-104 SS10]|uniref:DAGKc domain-containing protein n=1 Tax=Wolfiporia cocos (strain MD-104) TaxID=742152 RepID=A0A2H3J973_WOLCO|nr:hypothetical protein WOLCODRAFT_136434 [Wolfiporia cocos MD-104 SS10]
MPTLVVYNPVCGDGTASAFFSEHVLPLLASAGITPDKVLQTERAGHAGEFVTSHLEAVEGPFTIVLGSGDGTLHEVIEALTLTPPRGTRASAPPAKLAFALVPCGTANALYASLFPPASDADAATPAYRLRSLRAFLARPAATPLTLALTTLAPPPHARTPPRTAVSAVVASTALHASILHDSEALRASVPGLERFKRAAAQNITRWYRASATLFPVPGAGVVQVFDARTQAWAPHPQSTGADPFVDVSGPFAYFVSTVNVDRLEPRFRIAPQGRSQHAEGQGPAMEVVIVRPERDPSVEMDSEEARAAFAEKIMAVLGSAYQDGAHVGMRYAEDGRVLADGDGPLVVEYVRCGGWEWEPDDIDEHAHYVCADGDIHVIDKGGKATCVPAAPVDDKSGFAVFV